VVAAEAPSVSRLGGLPCIRYSYHVDNPDRDGRVLTAILYLNPAWKVRPPTPQPAPLAMRASLWAARVMVSADLRSTSTDPARKAHSLITLLI
jgi:hypothetical protein